MGATSFWSTGVRSAPVGKGLEEKEEKEEKEKEKEEEQRNPDLHGEALEGNEDGTGRTLG
jgi:hypothetical protein